MLMPAGSARAACSSTATWPAWDAFKQQFISADGRVIDPFGPRKTTTSEGQAYSLFFALVANDRAAFELALRWTENNLAAGDLRSRLPAWQWGQRDDGSWNVLDSNAASDADLWIVYALNEASRLWNQPRYGSLAIALADRVLSEETTELIGLGRVLLPGPQGFGPWTHAGIVRAKVNPSYLPLPVLRSLADGSAGQRDAWRAVLATAIRALDEGAPRGLAADWLLAQASSPAVPAGWLPDDGSSRSDVPEGVAFNTDGAATGSYNAIRVYMWLGLTDEGDPARRALVERYAPMADLTAQRGTPPEVVDLIGTRHEGSGPPGFSAALLPYLDALGRPDTARQQSQRLVSDPLRADAYYEQSLALFALGHREGFFRFDAEGHLLPRWNTCAARPVSAR